MTVHNKRRFIGKGRGRVIVPVLIAAACVLTGAAVLLYPSGNESFSALYLQDEDPEVAGALEVHFIDVGQGDAVLILCGDEAMLIDAGDNDSGDEVVSYLESQGVEELEYLIGSHPDADHIGGLDDVIYAYDCGAVLMPDCERDTGSYLGVMRALESRGYEITCPSLGEVYVLGEASFTITAPVGGQDEYGDETNNYSIGILLEFGGTSFLFTGDAESEAEEDMLGTGLDIDADVWKAAHHGSSDAILTEFVEAVSPEYVVISCGADNDYGHPHRETLELFESLCIEVYRTDEQGTVVAVSDGSTVSFTTEY